MAQTALDLCNLAIGRAGGEEIDAIGENTPLGLFCQTAYPQARDWLLSRHRWTFSTRIAQLARRSTTPAGWPTLYAYDPPGDLVGAVHAWRTGPREIDLTSRVLFHADGLASDDATLWAEYSARVSEDRWPASFVQLVSTAFASMVAHKMMNRSLASDLREDAFGLPGEEGLGGLFGAAMREDSRLAPQRNIAGVDGGALLIARGGWTGIEDPDFVRAWLRS
jgi:hypothetical protein